MPERRLSQITDWQHRMAIHTMKGLHLDHMARSWLWEPCNKEAHACHRLHRRRHRHRRSPLGAQSSEPSGQNDCEMSVSQALSERTDTQTSSYTTFLANIGLQTLAMMDFVALLVCDPWACLDVKRTKTCLWIPCALNYVLLLRNSLWIFKDLIYLKIAED